MKSQIKYLSNQEEQAIIHAAFEGDLNALYTYHQVGVNLDDIHDLYFGDGLMHIAVYTDQPQLFNALIDLGLDVNNTNPYYNETPVNTAAIFGNTQFISPLVEHGADLNSVDSTGFTPLLNAMWFMEYPTADFILTFNEVDVNITSMYGVNPLLLAYMDDEWSTLDAIIEHPSYDATFNYILVQDVFGIDELAHYLSDTGHMGDQNFIEAFQALQWLGMRYDFDAGFSFANSQSYQFTFAFEGAMNPVGLAHFCKGFEAFYHDVVENASISEMGEIMYQQVYEALQFSNQTLDPQEYLERYQNHEPVLIQSGWDAHSIVFVMHDDRLYRCNRGMLAEEGIEEFIIHDPSAITVELIENMLIAEGSPYYLQYDILEEFGLEKVGFVEMPLQTVGNCVWTSLEAGIEATMITSLVDQGLDAEQAHTIAQQNFDVWKSYDLDYGLSQCIQNKEVLIEQGLYDEVLLRILEANHDATDPNQVERGLVILNELTYPDTFEIFDQNIGELVNSYDSSSFDAISYMNGYETELGFNDWVWDATGTLHWTMTSEEYQLAKEYHQFLIACEHFEAAEDHFILELSDIFTQNDTGLGLETHTVDLEFLDSPIENDFILPPVALGFEHNLHSVVEF